MALSRGEVVVVVIERGVEAAVRRWHAGDSVKGGEEVGGLVEVLLPGWVVVGLDVIEDGGTAGAGVLRLETVDIGGLSQRLATRSPSMTFRTTLTSHT
jgi:hypothetical protein